MAPLAGLATTAQEGRATSSSFPSISIRRGRETPNGTQWNRGGSTPWAWSEATSLGSARTAAPGAAWGSRGRATPSEHLSHVVLRQQAVFILGLSDSPQLTVYLSELLRLLNRTCGPVKGAFRFPSAPPYRIHRPHYTSTVVLVVFEDAKAAAVAVRQLRGALVGPRRIYVKESAEFTLSDASAELCMRTFLPAHPTDPMAGVPSAERERALAASSRLWTLLLSPLSTFHIDWRAAKAAVERGDVVAIDEANILLPYVENPLMGAATRSARPETAERVEGGGTSLDRASAQVPRRTFPPSSSAPNTLQEQYYRRKYGTDEEPSHGSFWLQLVRGGWHYVLDLFGQKEEPLSYGREAAEVPGLKRAREVPGLRPVHDRDSQRGVHEEPLRHCARVESSDPRQPMEPLRIPRLTAIGTALSWMPGFHHLLPLVSMEEEEEERTAVRGPGAEDTHGNDFTGEEPLAYSGAHGIRRGGARNLVYPKLDTGAATRSRGDVLWTTETLSKRFPTSTAPAYSLPNAAQGDSSEVNASPRAAAQRVLDTLSSSFRSLVTTPLRRIGKRGREHDASGRQPTSTGMSVAPRAWVSQESGYFPPQSGGHLPAFQGAGSGGQRGWGPPAPSRTSPPFPPPPITHRQQKEGGQAGGGSVNREPRAPVATAHPVAMPDAPPNRPDLSSRLPQALPGNQNKAGRTSSSIRIISVTRVDGSVWVPSDSERPSPLVQQSASGVNRRSR